MPEHSPDQQPSTYRDRLNRHKKTLKARRSRLFRTEVIWSYTRLLLFVAAAIAWHPLRAHSVVAILASSALLILFTRAVKRHRRVRERRELADRTLVILDESLSRCGAEVKLVLSHDRPDDATKHLPPLAPAMCDGPSWKLTPQELDDLDLYSPPVGIFGLLNRCSMSFGRRRLRDMIENMSLSPEHVRARQETVQWLEKHYEQRLRMMGAAAIARNISEQIEHLSAAIGDAKPLSFEGRVGILRVWSILTAIATIASTILVGLGNNGAGVVVLVLMLINGIIYYDMHKALNRCLRPWRTVRIAVRSFLHAAQQAAENLPEHTELSELKKRLKAAVAENSLPSLKARVEWADSGGMMHAFFNAMFFWDLHVADSILKCVLTHRHEMLEALAALGDLEAVCSLACFACESTGGHPMVYPQVEEEAIVEITGGRHPLLPPERVVANDVCLNDKEQSWIVTGSNMAGKSTLLRMVGTSVVLAQAGTAIPAEKARLSPVRLITDLQVRDDLSADESYFLAEVRHLRRMIRPENADGLILGLMDEPFRGTNSGEQVAAAVAVVEHIASSSNLFIVATHEQALTSIPDRIRSATNFHFQENLSADGLVFDYKLQPGPATTRIALRILEREGYPDSLLQRAKEWLKQTNRGESK